MWGLFVASVLMWAGQQSVVIADGAWWAFAGTAMFGYCAAVMWRGIRFLRGEASTSAR